jgi:hypothetical protein
MSIDKRDIETMKRLAGEGKQITKIVDEDFPNYEYLEIYETVYSSGGQSALGVKRTIANRLNELYEAGRKQDRVNIIDEIDELVWHLYESLKKNQKKLDSIRAIINK